VLHINLHPSWLFMECEAPLQRDTGDWLREEDLALLCCFAPDFGVTRHHRQLHLALRRAGYSSAAARHLIRISPLLVSDDRRRYRLTGCSAEVRPLPPV